MHFHNFVFLSFKRSQFPVVFKYNLPHAAILSLKSNNLKALFYCQKVPDVHVTLKSLDLSFNQITSLQGKSFVCFSDLRTLKAQHNEIASLEDSTFETLCMLQILDLSCNKLMSLGKFTASCNVFLILLNITLTDLDFIDHELFSKVKFKVILTDDFQICCMNSNPDSICTAKPLWPSSCTALLSNMGLKVISWILSFMVVFLNSLSAIRIVVLWYQKKNLKLYDQYVLLINFCDVTFGLYLLTVSILDAAQGERYVESDKRWRKGVICVSLAVVSLLSVVLEALFLLMISIARYRVVTDPFEKPFGKKVNIIAVVLIPFILATALSVGVYLRKYVEGISGLSSTLCVLLGRTDKSLSQKLISILVPVYLNIFFWVIIFLYFKTVTSERKTTPVLDKVAQMKRQKSITVCVILAGATNALCWIPSSVFFLVSVSVAKFPVQLLSWVTLVVLPLNAVLNPVIFNLSEIKLQLKQLTKCDANEQNQLV